MINQRNILIFGALVIAIALIYAFRKELFGDETQLKQVGENIIDSTTTTTATTSTTTTGTVSNYAYLITDIKTAFLRVPQPDQTGSFGISIPQPDLNFDVLAEVGNKIMNTNGGIVSFNPGVTNLYDYFNLPGLQMGQTGTGKGPTGTRLYIVLDLSNGQSDKAVTMGQNNSFIFPQPL